MRRLLFTMATMLAGCTACLAQVSTMGSTAMGLSSTPGTILTSPLNGPSPFSATTQPGAPDTTLAPVPLASDPTTPGTVVTCSTPAGQITPGTPAVSVASLSAAGGTTGSISAAPTTFSVSASTSTTVGTTAPLLLSATPATSFLSTIPGTTIPASSTPATAGPTPATSSMSTINSTLTPSTSTIQNTVSTPVTGSTATTLPSTATSAGAPLGTIPTLVVGTRTGNASPTTPLGNSSTIVCSSIPGGPPTNSAALPLSTPAIPSSPPPGTIQPAITQLVSTSIDPTMIVMPTPNTSACAESVTMDLATPGTMSPANATGAAATPGVSPISPSGC